MASVLLILVGTFHVLQGISAVNGNDPIFGHPEYSLEMNLTAWGWIHLSLGVAAVIIGIGILLGQSWGYMLGLVIAFLSALGNFAFLPHQPIWSLLLIAFDVLVVWALVAELREPE
jgi:hypothetical protein